IKFDGLHCPNCAKSLENQLNKLESVKSLKIEFLKEYIIFDADDYDKAENDIINLTKQLEPDVKLFTKTKTKIKSKKALIDTFVLVFGIIVGLFALFAKLPTWAYWTLFVSSALLMGYKTYYKAAVLLLKGTVNENLLVTISVIGATAVGEAFDALMVIALYSVGKILEGLALSKSKKSIEDLTNLKPEFATLVDGDTEKQVDPASLNIGDIILVKAGERVAIDGIIIEGTATLDTKSLTGESLPQTANTNDEILSGSIVLDGVLKIKATKKYEDSTVSKIMDMIENASEKKSKTETVISKMTKWYTLGVIACSIIVFSIVLLITKNFDTALYRGMIFLVVSCPCAFAISVPLAYFSGIGNASSKGILIKGSNYLDALAKLNMIAFDKTGTLTTGEFEVVKTESLSKTYTEEDILYLASLGEQYSLHPLAKSIVQTNKKKLKKVKDVKEIAGVGVSFKNEDKSYFVGRKSENLKGTIVELFENDEKIGQITLQDKIKKTSKNACTLLKKLGIKTVMLSGDNKQVVSKVASEIGIDEAHAKLLPGDKFAYIENQKQNKNIHLGYVGDGLNDAPSLMLADVGISMGISGSTASIEASDVVLATDNPEKVASAVKISKYTRSIVWQNIILSAIIKLTFLTLGTIGITGMLAAVIADVGVTVVAILNSLRALHYNPKKK
ncbi:MAG: cadmium-translocating P-type ATPase, partial [Clostridia bacterium]|nr:cadmium-translocating P-type ATPase [Clostridia bacterium]